MTNRLPTQSSTRAPTAAPRTHLPPSHINNNNTSNNNNNSHPLYQVSKLNALPTYGGDNRPALPPSNVKRKAHDLENRLNFQLPNAADHPPNKHLVAPPVYTAPDIAHKRPMPTPASTFARLATPEVDETEMDMRGARALPPDTGSDHSGGSNETVLIDDVIVYADA